MSIKTKNNEILQWETIDADQAAKYLETMGGKNRPVRQTVVEKYTRDMKAGRWRRTTTPIKFDTSGVLFDGQHRLWALIEAGISFEFLIARGCDPDERHVQDIGAPRSVGDVMSFEGLKVSKNVLAVANQMNRSFQLTWRPTIQEQRQFYLMHEGAIRFVMEKFDKRVRGIGQAAMLAPVARAWYSEDRDKLQRWLEVFREGIPANESEYIIVKLRNFALATAGAKHSDAITNYGKAERALRAYLDGERLATLYAANEEMFPIPNENGSKPKTARPNPKKRGK